MKERIFKNYVTTLIGLGLIIFCGVLVFSGKANIEEVSGWFATGTLLIRSKDSILNLKSKE